MEDGGSNPLTGANLSLKMEEQSIAGLYKHFKGDLYIVFGEGVHTETNEQYVVYRSFVDPHGKFFIRPSEQFFGKAENEDEVYDRFTKLSEEDTIREVGKMVEEMIGTQKPTDCGCDECSCPID